ncbi:MAG: PhoPQ-activated pathogenicity-related family protein [Blastocatellia bacterium]
MKKLIFRLALLCLFSLPSFAQATAPSSAKTPLDKYIEAPDPSYKYQLVSTIPGKGYTTFVIDMTSQTWRAANEVNRNVWKHWMIVIKPDNVTSTKSLLYIAGGNNNSPAPTKPDDAIAQIAVATKSVVTELRMIPNQPLTFADDPQQKSRTEDEMIAYTWDKFLKTGDESWPARLPMTKAAVRAMDTVVDLMKSDAGGKLNIDGFVVTGGSKRGWTTWTTGAVDKRVIGIIPIVIDLLNIVPSFKHHYAAYGYFAPAVGDYETEGIMNRTETPEYKALMKIVEPYEYRQRMTMPKFMINATGDQFFLPDSWQFYYNDLPGVKYLRYVPNAEHSLRGSDAWFSVMAYYNAMITKATLPQFDWKIEKDGSTIVTTKDKPSAVKIWQATNPGARDFRVTTIGLKWKSTDLSPAGDGKYIAKLNPPKHGWTAYMVELTYPSGIAAAPYKFTTGVKVLPDVLPFKDEPLPSLPAQSSKAK